VTSLTRHPDTGTAPTSPRTDGESPTRQLPLLLAAAALVVLVVGLVLAFGIGRPPPLTSLTEAPMPAPSAPVAWTAWDDPDGTCVQVARVDGAVERLTCIREGGELVGWDDEGLLLRTWRGNSETVVVLDPDSGELLDRREPPRPEEEPPWPDEAVFVERDGGRLVVTDADDPDLVLWEVEAVEAYRVESSARSTDGAWIAMVDSARRLLLVPGDGSREPRVWAEDVEPWTPLVWGPS
jgi:hypothetical protein